LLRLNDELTALTRSCTDSLRKALQQYHGEDPWLIGSLPGCAVLADGLENNIRGVLTNSQLSPAQISGLTETLKTTADLRGVARSARQVIQIYWLLKEMDGAEEMVPLVRQVGESALSVAQQAMYALEKRDAVQARAAALSYREVDFARAEAERELMGEVFRARFPRPLRRTARAAVWFMAIAGEGMARVAARSSN
jgi:hypothetical protein